MQVRELAETHHQEASAALLFLKRCELPTGIPVPPPAGFRPVPPTCWPAEKIGYDVSALARALAQAAAEEVILCI